MLKVQNTEYWEEAIYKVVLLLKSFHFIDNATPNSFFLAVLVGIFEAI